MDSQKTKFTVGLFVACGIGIALVAVIWLGMSRIFEKGSFYAAFFNESVQGLDVDSPVKYRGVSVGRVESIGVAPDSKLIQVVLKIESGQKLESDIVAQLKSVGITGSMFIELDRKRDDEPDLSPHLNFPTEYQVVGSKPSGLSQILKGIDDVLKKIKSVDLEGISDRVKSGLDVFSSVLKKTDGILAANEGSINKTIVETGRTMEHASEFFGKGSSLVAKTDNAFSYLERQLLIIAQNLEKTSENLERLTELLADQPSQLIFGEPPSPRKMEPGFNKE